MRRCQQLALANGGHDEHAYQVRSFPLQCSDVVATPGNLSNTRVLDRPESFGRQPIQLRVTWRRCRVLTQIFPPLVLVLVSSSSRRAPLVIDKIR